MYRKPLKSDIYYILVEYICIISFNNIISLI